MKIAMLTYSVKPRGGVEHALAVAEALAGRGHDVRVAALAAPGETFFRDTAVPAHLVAHVPGSGSFDERILAMVDAYREGLRPLLADGDFDIVHAQDCLSANAALDLRDEGVIGEVVRTVHHVDDFISPSLIACQDRSILAPDLVLCVSSPWVDRLALEFGVDARQVRNGVDCARFRATRDAAERAADRAALGLGERLTVLTVGGIEPRKGSLTLLDGFARLRELASGRAPLLLVVGGATLFDYRDEIDRFAARARELGVSEHVRLVGTVSPAELERHYRAADLFAFPSTKEGFGLVALEALAAGLPVVATALDVFETFLADGETALLTPAGDGDALGRALARLARDPALGARLVAAGRRVVDAYGWDTAAVAHEDAYRAFTTDRIGAV
ncbi:MAG TPA: MSMEG_0565 family glycosyltransferase [Solirubrobacteraceae bacterium]|jgi:glycosyltransferase-like protein|nr:MSMEG_0565 family glycosyltransferase [Solirubrobacteraceae bacterium]